MHGDHHLGFMIILFFKTGKRQEMTMTGAPKQKQAGLAYFALLSPNRSPFSAEVMKIAQARFAYF